MYLELFEKYKKDYGLEHILEGHFDRTAMEQLKTASFDERLSVVGMLMGKLSSLFKRMLSGGQVCDHALRGAQAL